MARVTAVLAAWLGLSQARLAVDTQQGPVVGRARREVDTRTRSHVSWTEFQVSIKSKSDITREMRNACVDVVKNMSNFVEPLVWLY